VKNFDIGRSTGHAREELSEEESEQEYLEDEDEVAIKKAIDKCCCIFLFSSSRFLFRPQMEDMLFSIQLMASFIF